jgi:hypothetical protein
MSNDAIRRTNLGAVECERRPQLPDGFQRSSTRVGATFGATLTGLSVYELPSGQAVSPYHYEDPGEEWLLVVAVLAHCHRAPTARKCRVSGAFDSAHRRAFHRSIALLVHYRSSRSI